MFRNETRINKLVDTSFDVGVVGQGAIAVSLANSLSNAAYNAAAATTDNYVFWSPRTHPFALDANIVSENDELAEIERKLELMLASSATVIFCGIEWVDFVEKISPAYPDTTIVVSGGSLPQSLINVRSVSYRNDQLGFIAGTLAALVSGKKNNGCLLPDNSPSSKSYCSGFKQGLLQQCGIACENSYREMILSRASSSVIQAQIASSWAKISDFGVVFGVNWNEPIMLAAIKSIVGVTADTWVVGAQDDMYAGGFANGADFGAYKVLGSIVVDSQAAIEAALVGGVGGDLFGAESDAIKILPCVSSACTSRPATVETRLSEVLGMLKEGLLETGVNVLTGDIADEWYLCQNDCSLNGECVSMGKCECFDGWVGDGCEEKDEQPITIILSASASTLTILFLAYKFYHFQKVKNSDPLEIKAGHLSKVAPVEPASPAPASPAPARRASKLQLEQKGITTLDGLLKHYDLEKYSETFAKEDIDLEAFLLMEGKELEDFGLTRGAVIKLKKGLALFHEIRYE